VDVARRRASELRMGAEDNLVNGVRGAGEFASAVRRSNGAIVGAAPAVEDHDGRVTRAEANSSPNTNRPAHAVSSANYVTVNLASALTGYSPKAIRRKIEAGVWVERREFVRAPDGHVLIDLRGYHAWVARGQA